MFRPKTVSAHCAETSVSAIEVRLECAETSSTDVSASYMGRIIRPDLRIIYNFGIISASLLA